MRPSASAAWLFLVTATLTALYALVFVLTERAPPMEMAGWALANAVPAALLGWLIALAIVPMTLGLRPPSRLLAWLTIVVCHAMATYVATIILLAVLGDNTAPLAGGDGLIVRYFTGRAFVWQVFQGLAYGLVALLAGLLIEAERRRGVADSLLALRASAPTPVAAMGRLLIRTDDGIVPIDAADIIRIEGADDYSEVILPTRRLLARMRMSECESLLANEPMLRVHRSHIVNLSHLVGAEPAGNGRLQLHMHNGDIVMSSRAGAQALRAQTG